MRTVNVQHITMASIPNCTKSPTAHSTRPSHITESFRDNGSDSRMHVLIQENTSSDDPAYLGLCGNDREGEDSTFTERSSSTCVNGKYVGALDGQNHCHDDQFPLASHTTEKQKGLSASLGQSRTNLLWDWKWEILSMLASVGLLAAIAATLVKSNHKTQPEWPYNININSLVSVCTAIIFAQLGFVLAEIISQLKWLWFHQPHQLQDLEYYDAASRGMIGSVIFLARFLRHPRAHLAVGAALTLLLSAAIGPFAQQSVKSYACQRQLNNMTASIAAARYLDQNLVAGQGGDLELKMRAAALEGIAGLRNNSTTVLFDCPTGACDFPPYSSLAYCNSCKDIMSQVRGRYTPANPGLNNDSSYADSIFEMWNYTISGEDCELDLYDRQVRSSTRFINDSTILLVCTPSDSSANFTTMFLSWTRCPHDQPGGYLNGPGCGSHNEQLPSLGDSYGMLAMKCTLGLCVRDYTGRVRNSKLEETSMKSYASTYFVENYEVAILKLPCTIDSEEYGISNISQAPIVPGGQLATVIIDEQRVTLPAECVFKVGFGLSSAVTEYLRQSIFQPQASYGYINFDKPFCSYKTNTNRGRCNPWYLGAMFREGRFTAETISSDMDRMADAISNRMRAVGSNAYRNGSGVTLGTVIQTTVCVQVEWAWMILPAAVVLLTVVLFIAVLLIARCRHDRQPVWKSSALTAFFHGVAMPSRTPDPADGGTAHAVVCAHDKGKSGAALSLLRRGSESDLMTLESMHARAKKVVVKLDTATTGRRGFVMVINEVEAKYLGGPTEVDGRRCSADSPGDGRTRSSTHLPRNSSSRGQAASYLQVDLGIGLTPSIRGSLSSLTQTDLDRSSERAA